MNRVLEDFATKIVFAKDMDIVWNATCEFFENQGFVGVQHGVRNGKVRLTENDTRLSTSVSDWQAAYFSEEDDLIDPLFTRSEHTPEMFATGLEFLCDYPFLRPKEKAVIHRASDFGLISGLAMKMPSEDTQMRRGWNLLSDMNRKQMEELRQRSGSLFQVCAALADQKMVSVGARHRGLRLTNREAECLLWLANGMRTDQIAYKLGIRPVTVDMHVRNARHRLGAKTREQALAIAIHKGLIKP